MSPTSATAPGGNAERAAPAARNPVAPEPAGSTAGGAAHHTSHRWWVLAVIGLAQLMVVLDATIVNIALPSAQTDLHFSDNGRQWVVTAYSLAFASLLLLGGKLADLLGRKAMLLVGLIGFAAASALAGASTSIGMLIGGRAIQGAFGAVLAPAAFSLLTTTFTEPRERAKAFGIFGALAGSGGAIGLLLGGLLTEHLNWRWTLYVNLLIAVLAVIGALVFIHRPPRGERPSLDVPGTLLAAGGLFCVVYGFSNAETHAWSHWMTWGFLAAGVVLLLLFGLWEARAKQPLLPLRVLADRNRAASFLSVFVAGVGMFGVFLFLTYYLQETLHYSPVRTGLAFLPMIAALSLFAQVSNIALVPRIGAKPIVPVGCALAAGGLVWLTRLGLTSTYPAHVLPPLLLIGAGIGMVMPPAMSLATLGVARHDQGVASATVNTMQQVGGSIGVALFNTLAVSAMNRYIRDHQPATPLVQARASLHSYATAYWWAAGFFAAGLVISLLLYRKGSPMAQMRAAERAAEAEAGGVPEAGAAHEAETAAASEAETRPQPALAAEAEAGTEAEQQQRPVADDAPSPTAAAAGAVAGAAAAAAGAAAARRAAAPGSVALSGRVTGRGGEPVPDASVTLIDQTGRQLARTTADASGGYLLRAPGAGGYVLVGSAPGHQPRAAALAIGPEGIRHDLELVGSAGLAGVVRDGSAPVAGALVVATDPQGQVAGATTTGADGGYLFEDLLPGDFVLTVSAPGHRPTAEAVTVSGAGRTGHDVVLQPAAAVRGTVRSREGRPLADARVALLDTAGNVLAVRTTGEDGTYSFSDLDGADYTLVASGYPPVADRVLLNGSNREGVDLALGHEPGREG